MVADTELVILNAVTPGSSETTDILLKDGLIDEVGDIGGDGVDAGGRLVAPGFVNIHTHLDKADLLSKMNPGQFGLTLEENRELLKTFKKNYAVGEIKERACRVLEEFARNGVTALRTQVDVDGTCGLKPLHALTEVRDESPLDIQVCAFPQEGVVDKKSRETVEEALEKGADLLGGLPLVENTPDAREQHIEILFQLASEHGVDLEVQTDESNDPREFTLPRLAEKTIEYGMEGRVSATHCISLSRVDDKVAAETIELLKKAQVNVIVTPSANMITRFDDDPAVHLRPGNSVTRVKELLDAGVNVALGTDNIRDIFYPLGNCSMLRETHVLASATRMTRAEDPVNLFNMASANGAKIMKLDYGVEPGRKADLIVLEAGSYRQALNGPTHIPYVIKDGQVICETKVEHGR